MRVISMLSVALLVLLFTAGCDSLPNFITGATIAECEALDTDSLRDTCYAELGVLREDLNLCDKASDEGSKFYCYEGIASKTNAVAVCEDITDSYWHSICFKNVGIGLSDASLCEEVTNQELQNDCFYRVALDESHVEYCGRLVDDIPSVERCVNTIAANLKDIRICNNLPTVFKQDRCRIQVVEAIGVPTACNLLQLDIAKEICFKKVKPIADARLAEMANNTAQ
jgi:hypothetical protein